MKGPRCEFCHLEHNHPKRKLRREDPGCATARGGSNVGFHCGPYFAFFGNPLDSCSLEFI